MFSSKKEIGTQKDPVAVQKNVKKEKLREICHRLSRKKVEIRIERKIWTRGERFMDIIGRRLMV